MVRDIWTGKVERSYTRGAKDDSFADLGQYVRIIADGRIGIIIIKTLINIIFIIRFLLRGGRKE